MDPNGRRLLPVACTLGASDGARRLEDWRRLVADAFAGRDHTTGRLLLTFRDLPSVGPELERLVAAERECCAFLSWNLIRAGNTWQLEITGDDDGLQALSLAD